MGGISGSAAQQALKGQRMPIRHHAAVTEAYPDLPLELLPDPRDVPFGPRPKGLQDGATHEKQYGGER